LKLTERDLSQVQQSFLGDLEGGFDEEALAAMHAHFESAMDEAGWTH